MADTHDTGSGEDCQTDTRFCEENLVPGFDKLLAGGRILPSVAWKTQREVKTMADAFEQVKTIIVDLLGVEPDKVTRDARFREDLGADSLDLVELIMEFEERFGETISDEDAQKLQTVGQVVDYVEQRIVAGE
jgi:acyl carrier protein